MILKADHNISCFPNHLSRAVGPSSQCFGSYQVLHVYTRQMESTERAGQEWSHYSLHRHLQRVSRKLNKYHHF